MKVLKVEPRRYLVRDKGTEQRAVALTVDGELFKAATEQTRFMVMIATVDGKRKAATFKLGIIAVQPSEAMLKEPKK